MKSRHVDTGAGEPVLLLHGYPQSAACWRHQIPALAERHRVIAADWPGFGRAEPPDTPATYDAEVDRIGALADSFGLDRFNLVAHDYGGFLGLGFVQRHPARVMRLALLNTRAHNIFRPWFYRFSQNQQWLAVHVPALLRHLPLRRLHHIALRPYRKMGCFDERLEDEYLGWMETPRGRQTFVDFFTDYHVPAVPGLAEGLSRISCPTAIIWGDRDRYIPFATARELAERIPGATLTRLTGGNHYIMEERPHDVTAALLELLARTPSVVR
jgi:pimeloyl-ACP methyl ester carboxylesterase